LLQYCHICFVNIEDSVHSHTLVFEGSGYGASVGWLRSGLILLNYCKWMPWLYIFPCLPSHHCFPHITSAVDALLLNRLGVISFPDTFIQRFIDWGWLPCDTQTWLKSTQTELHEDWSTPKVKPTYLKCVSRNLLSRSEQNLRSLTFVSSIHILLCVLSQLCS